MERIFGRSDPKAAPRRPRPATARAGIASAGIAGGLAITGLIAFLTLDRHASPPVPVAGIAPIRPAATARHTPDIAPARPAPPTHQRADAAPVRIATPRMVSVRKVPLHAVPVRISRPVAPAATPRLEAPHLTGEALRRALADDVVITRRLNREALEGQADIPSR